MHPSDFGSNRSRVPPIDRNSAVDVNRLSTWYEDLEEYEGNLEEMANANLDQTFQDEMAHVNQWFGYLSDSEKTATLYTLLQHSSQVQIRFFIHLLQEMRKPKPSPLNRGSERASTLMNLNRRQQQQQQTPTNRNMNNRHSFALGDTEELSRMFGNLNSDWLQNEEHTTLPPQQRSQVPPRASTNNLRPKSVMEMGPTTSFSNSWLNQRQPKLFNENVIERPRSADISSWNLPTTVNTSAPSWKPLGSQHDLDFKQHWREPTQQQQQQRFSASIPEGTMEESTTTSKRNSIISTPQAATAVFSNDRSSSTTGFGQFLSPPKNFNVSRSSSADLSEGLHGYGSDQGDYRTTTFSAKIIPTTTTTTTTTNTTINESRGEDYIDMELLKDVTAWFRSLRLHKYNSVFEPMCWQDIVKLDDDALQAKGVAALGARRKMLKVFENVREHCKVNNIEY